MLPSDVIFAVGELPSLGRVGKAVKMSQTPPALPPAPLPVLAEDGEREGVCGSLFPRPSPSACPPSDVTSGRCRAVCATL